jgi:hypothetical protein
MKLFNPLSLAIAIFSPLMVLAMTPSSSQQGVPLPPPVFAPHLTPAQVANFTALMDTHLAQPLAPALIDDVVDVTVTTRPVASATGLLLQQLLGLCDRQEGLEEDSLIADEIYVSKPLLEFWLIGNDGKKYWITIKK